MSSDAVVFQDKAFVFTGKLAELKRSQAQREARARGAFTTAQVHERVDYVVVGSLGSTGWKHGSYGRKLEKARALAAANPGRPRIIDEGSFMEALADTAPTNSGDIDAKVIVATYKFVAASEEAFDLAGVEDWLTTLHDEMGCLVRATAEPAFAYVDLFGGERPPGYEDDALVIRCRITKQLPVEEQAQSFVDVLEQGFEPLDGVDGTTRWFERREGTAGYIRLLQGIPKSLRVEGL